MGTRDMTLDVMEKMAGQEVLIHGLAIKPGKPTLVTIINNKPVIGLPGHPTAALTIYNQFVKPLVLKLTGQKSESIININKIVEATIDCKVASTQGRLDFIRVKICQEEDLVKATPIFGSSGLIQTLIKADGLVRIPFNKEGLNKGEKVQVQVELF